jgi:hypothetical protein
LLLHGHRHVDVQRPVSRAWPREPEARVAGSSSSVAYRDDAGDDLAQMGLWAAALKGDSARSQFRRGFYFASVTYTTLGLRETK